jgi:XRE family transcriptional regulator, regulator of sulfur utilization
MEDEVLDERGRHSDADWARIAVLGSKVRAERQAKRLSLEAMARRSGVSRSMLSAIERGTKVPTVLVLDRIANALGVSVSRLLDRQRTSKVVELRAGDQQVVGEQGWNRNIVSPVLPNVDLELGRLEFEPSVDAGEFAPHQSGWGEYVVVEEGSLEIMLDRRDRYLLERGDALYFESDLVHAFRNPGEKRTVAYILMINCQ